MRLQKHRRHFLTERLEDRRLLSLGWGGSFPVASGPFAVATADFNNDGKLDLATANPEDQSVSVLLGDGSGGFGEQHPFATGSGTGCLTTGDFNNDGKIDLASGNAGNDTVSVLLGNGVGGFASPLTTATFPDPGAVAVGHFNNDGKLDLVYTSAGPNALGYVEVMLGNGLGGFTTRSGREVRNPNGLAVADLNTDGKLDVVTTTDTSFAAAVLLGNGDGTLTPRNLFLTSGSWPRAVGVGDFTGDGILDLVATGWGSGWVSVLPGNGDGTFDAAITNGSYLGDSIATADFNGDGKLDVVTGHWSFENLSLLLGRGNGTFAPPAQPGAGYGIDGIVVGDFNSDARPDVAIADYLISGVVVLLNDGNWANKTYIGPASGNWSTPAHWSPTGVPGTGDQVLISGAHVNLSATVAVTGLNLISGAELDLNDHDLVINYSGGSPIGSWNGAAYTGITGLIQSQRITASIGVGIAEISGDVVIRATPPGDANLDGIIDGDDFFAIDSGYASQARGYASGDFDYNGAIDADDYFLIDSNYSTVQTPPALAGGSELPAPVLFRATPPATWAAARVIEALEAFAGA